LILATWALPKEGAIYPLYDDVSTLGAGRPQTLANERASST
jgi:hypothetical protein